MHGFNIALYGLGEAVIPPSGIKDGFSAPSGNIIWKFLKIPVKNMNIQARANISPKHLRLPKNTFSYSRNDKFKFISSYLNRMLIIYRYTLIFHPRL